MNTKYNFRGEKFIFTSQRALRRAFWDMCEESNINTVGKKTRFNLDLNMMFNDWIDGLCKDAQISEKLRDTATLY